MVNQDTTVAFDEMSLTPQTIKAVQDMGYTEATAIQTAAIPLLLGGHDLIGRSSTGTGKTAAFGIPAIESVNPSLEYAQVLVLSPTRELAMQICVEMKKFAKYKKGVSIAVVYGGSPMGEQIKKLRDANIVIGTPGRLMDHIRRGTLKLNRIETVVLDEADEMLNMGFIDDIETILTEVPEERQTVLFSATMPASLKKISEAFLTNPLTVDAAQGKNNQADIEQTYYQVAQHKKREALTLLMYANKRRVIIFSNTKSMVDELADQLSKQGFEAAGLHGDMTQAARTQVMQGFRNGTVNVLVATDVAARGIDVDDVDVVINFDLPQSFEYYVHRIGRTGRAGRKGLSQTLVCNGNQYKTLRALMSYTGSTIQERKLPTSDEIMCKAVSRVAGKVLDRVEGGTGKAAAKLVEQLLQSEQFEGSPEQVATALAEVLVGGDEQFERLKNVGMSAKTTPRGNPSKNRADIAKRKHKKPKPDQRSQGGERSQGKRNAKSHNERNAEPRVRQTKH